VATSTQTQVKIASEKEIKRFMHYILSEDMIGKLGADGRT